MHRNLGARSEKIRLWTATYDYIPTKIIKAKVFFTIRYSHILETCMLLVSIIFSCFAIKTDYRIVVMHVTN